jgi:MFS transporter, DHA2 family, multidrug resistance protein
MTAAAEAQAKPPGLALFNGVSAGTFFGFLCMIGGMFMAILDIQIVSSSLTQIQAGLSASADEIAWVQSSYLIAEVIMIPFSGFLSRLMSTRLVFVISAAGFTMASVLCATATSLNEMIVFRALQGFIGGAMIPTVFAASFQIFGRERNAAIGVLWGLIATLAPTIGPTLGGYLTELISWHWLFLINVPPGIVICFAVWNLIDIDKPDWSLANNFDYAGLVSMALFLGTLHYVLEDGAKHDWLADETIRLCTAISIAAGAIFFWRTLTSRNPIVELNAFLDRNFAIGSAAAFLFGVCLYGVVYLIPVFLGRVQGLNSLQIGEIMFVTGLFQFMSAPLGGILARTTDPRLVMAIGLSLLGLSNWLFTPITPEWGFWELFWPQAIRGIGLMWSMIPINMIAMGTLDQRYLKSASGLFNLVRNLGGAFGLGILNTQLTDRMGHHLAHINEALNPARPAVQDFLTGFAQRFELHHGTDGGIAAYKVLEGLAQQQALTMTFADLFLGVAIGCAAILLTLPFVERPHAFLGPKGDAH